MAELRDKEIINISDGCRFGYVGDVELDLETGKVKALVVPGRLRFFGLLGREEDYVFPWECVRRFGEDIILVEAEQTAGRPALDEKRGLLGSRREKVFRSRKKVLHCRAYYGKISALCVKAQYDSHRWTKRPVPHWGWRLRMNGWRNN